MSLEDNHTDHPDFQAVSAFEKKMIELGEHLAQAIGKSMNDIINELSISIRRSYEHFNNEWSREVYWIHNQEIKPMDHPWRYIIRPSDRIRMRAGMFGHDG